MSGIAKTISIGILCAALALLAACGGGGSNGGDTARPITSDELTKMALSVHQFGPDVRGFVPLQTNGAQTIDAMAGNEFDPTDEHGDLERSGFEAGYDEAFITTGDPMASGGIFMARSGVIQFADARGAEGYFADVQVDLGNLVGKTNPTGYVANEATRFAAVSSNSIGAHIVTTGPDGAQYHGTQTMFLHGRLVGYVSLSSIGGADFDRPGAELRVTGLMAVMDQQVQFALAGSEASNQDGSDGGPLYVSNAVDALGKSAEQFQDKVDSFTGTFYMEMSASSFSFSANGTMAYEAPDRFYMKMNMSGTDGTAGGSLDNFVMEMIADGGKFYMSTPITGWVYLSSDDAGTGDLQKLIEDRGVVNYSDLISQLGGDIQEIGIEQIEGGSYRHYRVSLDFGDMTKALGGTLDSGSLGSTVDLSKIAGPITMDFWVDRDSLLPYKVTAQGTLGIGGAGITMSIAMTFGAYGQPAVIPEPPSDAVPIKDAFGNVNFDQESVQQALADASSKIQAQSGN